MAVKGLFHICMSWTLNVSHNFSPSEHRTQTTLSSTVTPAAVWACTTERWLWKTSIKYNLKMNMNSGINSHLLFTFKLISVDFLSSVVFALCL